MLTVRRGIGPPAARRVLFGERLWFGNLPGGETGGVGDHGLGGGGAGDGIDGGVGQGGRIDRGPERFADTGRRGIGIDGAGDHFTRIDGHGDGSGDAAGDAGSGPRRGDIFGHGCEFGSGHRSGLGSRFGESFEHVGGSGNFLQHGGGFRGELFHGGGGFFDETGFLNGGDGGFQFVGVDFVLVVGERLGHAAYCFFRIEVGGIDGRGVGHGFFEGGGGILFHGPQHVAQTGVGHDGIAFFFFRGARGRCGSASLLLCVGGREAWEHHRGEGGNEDRGKGGAMIHGDGGIRWEGCGKRREAGNGKGLRECRWWRTGRPDRRKRGRDPRCRRRRVSRCR